MAEGKIIRCCADCVYYNQKKHLCNLGHSREDNPRNHFYDDCTSLEDLAEHDKKVRAEAIDEYNAKIKECCNIIGSCDFEDLDKIARAVKGE